MTRVRVFFAYGGDRHITELFIASFCDANGDDFFAEK